MFINCPKCGALVATDLATDLPPEHCPHCGTTLRQPPAEPRPRAEAPPATPVPAEAPAPAPSPPAPRFVALKPPQPAPPAEAVATAPAPDADTPPPAPAPAKTATPLASPPVGPEETDREREPIPSIDAADEAKPDDNDTPESAPAAKEDASSHADAPAAQDTTARTAPSRSRPAPSFLHRASTATRTATSWHRPTVGAVAALALLLVLQLLMADRARLAADAQWRPLIASVCGVLRCSLPPWHEPAAIALLQRDVRPHPDTPGALRVNATIRNDARWAQAWPHLVLTLSDVDGRALGTRRFAPEEYLGTAPTDDLMSSGQSAAIRMDIVEPSPHTVAFNFDFR